MKSLVLAILTSFVAKSEVYAQESEVVCYVCFNDPSATMSNPNAIFDLSVLGDQFVPPATAQCQDIFDQALNSFFFQQECNDLVANTNFQTTCGCTASANAPVSVPTSPVPAPTAPIPTAPVPTASVPTAPVPTAPVSPPVAAPVATVPPSMRGSSSQQGDFPSLSAPIAYAPSTQGPIVAVPTTAAPVIITNAPIIPTFTTTSLSPIQPVTPAPVAVSAATATPVLVIPTTSTPIAPVETGPSFLDLLADLRTSSPGQTAVPSTMAPITTAPTTMAPISKAPTTKSPTTKKPTTHKPTTKAPVTLSPTTQRPSLAPSAYRPPILDSPVLLDNVPTLENVLPSLEGGVTVRDIIPALLLRLDFSSLSKHTSTQVKEKSTQTDEKDKNNDRDV